MSREITAAIQGHEINPLSRFPRRPPGRRAPEKKCPRARAAYWTSLGSLSPGPPEYFSGLRGHSSSPGC
eukprot:8444789-Pyramimonas_sp.AAC.1